MKSLGKDLNLLLDKKRVLTDPVDMYAYSADCTYHLFRGMPDAVVLPESTEEVSRVVRYAASHSVPIVPRGAGTGMSGGCTPVKGGIVLDLKRMGQILEINRGNMTATVEAGVVLGRFQQLVESRGFFYPPDPQSYEVSTIGGNVATRAGGPRGVKYGTTPNYVLGLEAVLPDGTVIRPGGTCVKTSTGYNVTQLLTGSEGTLAVITTVNLRLLPLPPSTRTVIVVCETQEQAATIVTEIIARGIVPAKLEYIPPGAVVVLNNFLDPQLRTDGKVYLFMELDGTDVQLDEQSVGLSSFFEETRPMEYEVVGDKKKADMYWRARSKMQSAALRMLYRVIAEDVAVPRDRILDFVRAVQGIAETREVMMNMAGHAGDGNMHPGVVFLDADPEYEKRAHLAIEEMVKTGLSMGGTVSGEHGIGMHKAPFLALELGEFQIDLQKRIKLAFDPKGIMNPGKLWEYEG